MNIDAIEPLARTLQASISPVAMISGVGLLILSFTNRFSRVTDRIRELSHQLQESAEDAERTKAQIRIFLKRARLLRAAVVAASSSALLSAVMILTTFLILITEWRLQSLVLGLFALNLVSLIVALTYFLEDMRQSLLASTELTRGLDI